MKLAFKALSPLWRDLKSQAQRIATQLSALSATRLLVVVDRKNTLDRPWNGERELSALFSELADCFPRAQEVEVYAVSGKGRELVLRLTTPLSSNRMLSSMREA